MTLNSYSGNAARTSRDSTFVVLCRSSPWPPEEDGVNSALAVAAVALPGFCFVLRLALAVLRQGLAQVDHVLKAALVVAAHVALVRSGIDQFAFPACHDATPSLTIFERRRPGSVPPVPWTLRDGEV